MCVYMFILQAFARLSAVYGGTYMLHKSDAKVEYDEAGKAVGVTSEGETAKCKFVVGDASYFPSKTRVTSQVVRALCVLSHPIPSTDNAHSAQIILPQKQVGRRSGGAGGLMHRWLVATWTAGLCLVGWAGVCWVVGAWALVALGVRESS